PCSCRADTESSSGPFQTGKVQVKCGRCAPGPCDQQSWANSSKCSFHDKLLVFVSILARFFDLFTPHRVDFEQRRMHPGQPEEDGFLFLLRRGLPPAPNRRPTRRASSSSTPRVFIKSVRRTFCVLSCPALRRRSTRSKRSARCANGS